MTQSSFSSTVGLPKNKKIDWVPWSSNTKHQRKREEGTRNVRANYKDLLWHNSIHQSSPLHAKDSRSVIIAIFTGSTPIHGRNLQLARNYHPTFGEKATRNNNWIGNPSKNKWNSHWKNGKNTKNNNKLLILPDKNCEIRLTQWTPTTASQTSSTTISTSIQTNCSCFTKKKITFLFNRQWSKSQKKYWNASKKPSHKWKKEDENI